MTPDDITLMTRIVESSPVVVLVCLGFIILLLRWHARMEDRLKQQEELIISLLRETLQAMHEVKEAMHSLTEAIRSAR